MIDHLGGKLRADTGGIGGLRDALAPRDPLDDRLQGAHNNEPIWNVTMAST